MKTVYVFDLDGVITHPKDSQVNEAVVDIMSRLLESGDPFAVNTGRSYDWVEKNLVSRLKARGGEDILQRLIVSCEKGGETITRENGQPIIAPSEFALPENLYAIAKTSFQENQSKLQTMFWDDTKRTMATVEKKPSADLDEFHAEQKVLVEIFNEQLAQYQVRIDATTVATDVEMPAAGKHAGASLIFQWVQSHYPDFRNYISIGDSVSDYEMARYFADHADQSTFVYVGAPTDKIEHSEKVTLISPSSLYTEGTLEYFTSGE